MTASRPDALARLLSALLDGSITPEDHAALAERLRTDPAARAAYHDAVELQSLLRWQHADQANAPVVLTPESPAPARPASAGRPHSFEIPNAYVYAAAALVAIATVLVGIYAYVATLPQSETPDPQTPARYVATLIENSGGGTLTTPGGYISEGRDYPRGEYALSGGTAEFMLTNSVNVKLRGETRMVMHNDMNVSLAGGTARFVVPGGAVGFTVHTPDGTKIVDLGTEFRVNVAPDGSAQVKVIHGEVRIDRASGVSMLLNAQQSASIPIDTPDAIVRSAVIADLAGDWIDAEVLPNGWSYYDSNAANGGELRPLAPDQLIGNGDNRGFGGGTYNDFNLGAVLGERNEGEEFEIFVDGYEGHAAEPGKDLLVHASTDYLILRYTVADHAGPATIAGGFRELVTNRGDSVTASIYHNDTLVFTADGSDPAGADGDRTNLGEADGAFNVGVTLTPGDTIDFVIHNNEIVGADETAIRATIQLTPAAEPVEETNTSFVPSSPPVDSEPEA